MPLRQPEGNQPVSGDVKLLAAYTLPNLIALNQFPGYKGAITENALRLSLTRSDTFTAQADA